jgi:hypothetical protein
MPYIRGMPRATGAKNFHLPLPESVHRELRDAAAHSGRPATVLVREAVELWLKARRRARLHEELSAFAERWAGTPVDLDEALEQAAVEHLLAIDRPRARRKRAR